MSVRPLEKHNIDTLRVGDVRPKQVLHPTPDSRAPVSETSPAVRVQQHGTLLGLHRYERRRAVAMRRIEDRCAAGRGRDVAEIKQDGIFRRGPVGEHARLVHVAAEALVGDVLVPAGVDPSRPRERRCR